MRIVRVLRSRLARARLWVGIPAICIWLILFGLAGCVNPTSTPTNTGVPPDLPTPVARHTGLPEIGLPSPLVTEMPTASPVPETLEELARSVYGNRLVEWVTIPAIGVRAPVRPVGWSSENLDSLPEWDNPEAEVGWVVSSALPGDAGNIILYGHNNIHSSVFKRLAKLQTGDTVVLENGEGPRSYQVVEVTILPVSGADADLAAYQQFLSETPEETLTLLSCWPPDNNTHRVIVQAIPVNTEAESLSLFGSVMLK
jgi:LPXTG-site transpeptidase (sortase) family protein